MPARCRRRRRSSEFHLSWSQALLLVSEVEPIDGFVDVIRLQLLNNRNRLELRFDSREHVMLLLDAVLSLIEGLDKAASYVPHTKVHTLRALS